MCRVAPIRTNIEIDEALITKAMTLHRLRTKREAVDFALRRLVEDPLPLEDARSMRGSGWEGDLAELRASRTQQHEWS